MKQLIIITGLSGSGKSIALRALEDSDFYCIDNLPAGMLADVDSHLRSAKDERVVVSIDSRSAEIESLPVYLATLRAKKIDAKVFFLEANDETLMKRFSETRRKHPLHQNNSTLLESIAQERQLLGYLAEIGHRMDTSNLSANTLRTWIKEVVLEDTAGLTLLFASFGFKHGIPADADFVFDVRSLPNPYYDPALRTQNGKDAAVKAFLENHDAVHEMRADIQSYIEKWLPSFIKDHRSYLTVAIGCTGGQHRSVYFVETLSAHFKAQQKVLTRHRELT